MAAKPPAAGVAKVTMTFLCSARNFGDSFFLAHPAGASWSVAQLTVVANSVIAQWTAELAPLTSSSCSLVQVSVLDLSDDVGREAIVGTGVPGTVAGSPPLTMNSVARITFQISRRYRGGRPGINISGRVFSDLDDERTFTTADSDALLNAFSTLVTNVCTAAGGGTFQCAVSYILAHAVRAVPLVLPVIGREIQKRVCTLRKRLGKSVAELFG